jgi:CheY-like chemotaxis protein
MDPSQATNRTCMCVELDSDFYYLIQKYAERSGLAALLVSQGAEALQLTKKVRPVVVCLEPERGAEHTAWEVLAALKSDSETAAIPVILFSWLDEKEQALNAGASVYVKKPVMYVDFNDALAEAGIRPENQK